MDFGACALQAEVKVLGAEDHAQPIGHGLELGLQLCFHLLAKGQTLLGLHQTQRAQQFIALIVDGNAGRRQIAAIGPASGWQVAPAGFSQGLLMFSEVGLQRCGAGLDRSHMQHQAARLGRQQP